MNCSCVICWVRLQSNHNIIATDCGHIFHNKCLNEWIERSPTCPECRKDVKSTEIRRLYLSFTNDDSIQDDPAKLQEQIDHLQFLQRIHESQIEKLSMEKKIYEQKISSLDHDLFKQAQEIRKLESENYILEDQKKTLQAASEQGDFYKDQTAKLRVELETCRTYISHEKQSHAYYKSQAEKMDMIINHNNIKIGKLQQSLNEAEAKYMSKVQEVENLQYIINRGRLQAPTTSTINNDSILMSTLPDSDDLRVDQSPNRIEPTFPYNLVIRSTPGTRENKENEPLHNGGGMFSYFKRKMSPPSLCAPEYGQLNKRLMTPNYLNPFAQDSLDSCSKSEPFPTTSDYQKKNFVSITDTHLPITNNLAASSALSLSSSSISSQSSSSSTSSASSSENNSKPTELVDLTGDTSSIIIDLT